MFDIGWSEMAIIMLLALIIIGPKDLPRVARTIGQWVRKGRMLAREFQTSLEDMAKEAELDDVKKEIEKVGKTDLKKAVENTIDPKGDLAKAFDTSDPAGPTGTTDTGPKALNGSAEGEGAAPAIAKAPAKPVTKTAATAPKAAAPKKKPAAAAKKPAVAAKKPAASAKKPAAAKTARTAKKPAAPRKRAAKPASSAESGAKSGGGDPSPSSADDGGAAVAAKPS